MKKSLSILFVIALFVCTSLKGQTNNAKEEAAIKAVFEAEKAAYFKQDYAGMGEFWVKEPTTMKYWLGSKGSTKIVGWENINESQKKETEDNSWDRKQMTATFSNYQINIMGNSAWIFCETNWEGKVKGEAFNLKQERIVVMKKMDGKWKFSLYSIFQLPNTSLTNK
jgi:ketosteroid isomerase-like protein